jgi:hypothetical protein
MEVINLILASMIVFAAVAISYFKYVEWKDRQPPRK